MNWGNAGKPRFDARSERLTEDERRLIATLAPVGKEGARLLGMSVHTYYELMQPLGRVTPTTLARVRARLAELQETKNP